MTNAPRLLDKVVSLTGVQDVELMEFSLLKTIAEFVRPIELSILKLDRRSNPCYQLHLRQEKYEILSENFSLSDEISAAIQIVQGTKRHFRTPLDSGNVLTAWHALQTKSQNVFLVAVAAREFTKFDTHMIQGLLQIYRNFYEVLAEAQSDQLTGLANRKTFDEVIQKIYNQPVPFKDKDQTERRGGTAGLDSCWLAMIDVDNFKRINDTWGHLYGDEVLLLLSQLMQSHFRESDFLFRFGGEEFIVIVRTGDREQAHMAFERFRSAVENHPFPQVGKVTVSIGVTSMDPTIFTTTLLDQADQSLYHAKKMGRNMIKFFDELVQDGLVEVAEIVPGGIELF